jgi:superfamily I DNA/RNA helicase
MAWMIREDQLDPQQKEFINNESIKPGNVWVQGFAGSGKSVLLVFSLKDILRKEPNAKVAIVVFTNSLVDMFKTGLEKMNLPNSIPVMTYYEFVDRNSSRFDYVFCDEVQDLPAKVLQAMKVRAGKIIVAGDSNQSIYDSDPKWREPIVDPSQVGDIINARPFRLNIVHRLTRSIIAAVQKLLPSMNIISSNRDLTKQDVSIRLCEAMSEQKEVGYIYKEAQLGTSVGDSSAVLFPTNKTIQRFADLLLSADNKPSWVVKNNRFGSPDYDDLNRHFKANGIKAQFVGSGYGSFKSAEQNRDIIMMTYHSAKGLDFDNVFLPFLNNNLFISHTKEETLFMVAMTRSKKNLYLSYFGYTHDLVDRFKGECTEIKISEITATGTGRKPINSFDF